MHNGSAGNTNPIKSRAVDKLGASQKQLKFVKAYVRCRNARQAALRAGYSESFARASASSLLRRAAVAAAIEKRTEKAMRSVDLDARDILHELKTIMQFDLRELFDQESGKLITNPHHLPDDAARALVNADVIVLDRTGSYIIKVNPGNKLRAIELLGRSLGMWQDRAQKNERAHVTFSLDYGDGEGAGQ